MLQVPPLHHISDTAAKGLAQAMRSFDATVHGGKQICKLITSRQHRQRLLERCFGCAIGRCYHKKLQNFDAHIHLERWATWAFAIPQLLDISSIFRWGWSREKFMRGDGAHVGSDETQTIVNESPRRRYTSKHYSLSATIISWNRNNLGRTRTQ